MTSVNFFAAYVEKFKFKFVKHKSFLIIFANNKIFQKLIFLINQLKRKIVCRLLAARFKTNLRILRLIDINKKFSHGFCLSLIKNLIQILIKLKQREFCQV